MQYFIRSCKKEDGTTFQFPVWTSIRELVKPAYDNNKLAGSNGLGRNLRLRAAIKDFNWGLLDRDSAPFFFYREIETLAKIVLKLDLEFLEKPEQWEEFYNKIGATDKEKDYVKNILKTQYANYARHGTYPYYKAEELGNMLRVARVFLMRTLKYLDLIPQDYSIVSAFE